MSIVLNGTTGASFPDGSAGTPAEKGSTSATAGIFYPAANTVAISTNSTEALRVDSSQNVGIGTSSPGTKLDVVGTIRVTATNSQIWDGTTGTYATWRYNGTSLGDIGSGNQTISGGSTGDFAISSRSGNLILGTSNTERARIDSSGNFFIEVMATTASAANVFVDTATTPVNQIKRSTSSRKYKTDIRNYDKGIDIINTLRSVYYKGINDGDTQFAGLIAEEVDEAGLHEFVQYASDKTPDALAYGNMAALFVKAIQELSAKLDAAEARIAALEAK